MKLGLSPFSSFVFAAALGGIACGGAGTTGEGGSGDSPALGVQRFEPSVVPASDPFRGIYEIESFERAGDSCDGPLESLLETYQERFLFLAYIPAATIGDLAIDARIEARMCGSSDASSSPDACREVLEATKRGEDGSFFFRASFYGLRDESLSGVDTSLRIEKAEKEGHCVTERTDHRATLDGDRLVIESETRRGDDLSGLFECLDEQRQLDANADEPCVERRRLVAVRRADLEE